VSPADRKPDALAGRWSRSWPAGWVVDHVAETGSTNADLLAAAAARLHRSVLVADHQTAGRGRLDRRWDAPPGANLLVSLLLRAPADPGEAVRRVSLAALDACRTVVPDLGARAAIKWPNDLLLDHAKLAGVLAQSDGRGTVVVGVGVNVGWCPPGAAQLGADVDRGDLLAALLTAYDALPVDPGPLHDRYCRELTTIGQRVRIERPHGEVVGRALDVEADGRLVVLDDCGITHRLDVGDVTHLRPAPS
jgi:BirA family biotin operon repressor/biotin-[acetyl-CoA-carboxylase] ligase